MMNVVEHITEMPDFENGATALQTSGYFREKAELQRLV